MSESTAIEWTQATWNPVTGCSKVSAGCKHCYAETFAERWRGVPGHPYEQGFDLKLWPDRLSVPRRWRRPRRVFVNSMSDLFHEQVPDAFILDVFAAIEDSERHTFQLLTKRSERLARLAPQLPWPSNLWVGVSIEDMRVSQRADHLREVPAAVRFVSAEPLLGSLLDLDLSGIDWVIAGGESGPGHRRMDPEWPLQLRDRCAELSIAFFFKQWGGRSPKAGGRELQGREHSEYPTSRECLAPGRSSVVRSEG